MPARTMFAPAVSMSLLTFSAVPLDADARSGSGHSGANADESDHGVGIKGKMAAKEKSSSTADKASGNKDKGAKGTSNATPDKGSNEARRPENPRFRNQPTERWAITDRLEPNRPLCVGMLILSDGSGPRVPFPLPTPHKRGGRLLDPYNLNQY